MREIGVFVAGASYVAGTESRGTESRWHRDPLPYLSFGRMSSRERLAPVHSKQLLTYLRLMDQPLGLLMNFGADLFRNGLKRIINNRSDFAGRFTSSSSLPTER